MNKPTEQAKHTPKWRSPTAVELISPLFNVIWDAIKPWDVNVPAEYDGYCAANGNHVCTIMDALIARAPDQEAKITAQQAEIDRLTEALKKHEHTQQCVAYSVRTAMAGSGYHCIAECTNSHRTALTASGESPESESQ